MFTTCSNQKKRDYLQQTFAFLDDAHIGDSRSTSFEALIKKQARHLVMHTCPYAFLIWVCTMQGLLRPNDYRNGKSRSPWTKGLIRNMWYACGHYVESKESMQTQGCKVALR